MRKSSVPFFRCLLFLAVLAGLPSLQAAKAKLSVQGAGMIRNRELRVALNRLIGTEDKETLDGNSIEDAAVILGSSLGQQGYQHPEIVIETVLEDGSVKRF